MLTPTRANRDRVYACNSYRHDRVQVQLVERHYYTTFAIEIGVSFTTIAGTLERIGPFKVCDIVHPNITTFRKWVERRRTELAEQHRKYLEEWARREEAQEAALLCQAEQIAQQFWSEEQPKDRQGWAELSDGCFLMMSTLSKEMLTSSRLVSP